ncbi:bifunctional YncE family protein/alkaline phosphatase family protein [Aneurinibacillus sp. Ricciae_BoGa-3]|uniref:bifunctional YncE family protein/alkaline phosphatase family protein n=1 Tax=Aneurinibacillus sp. Ricciae_BoGa-3 TaxID=3022697 RepID=UPI0023404496|nr:bifunctional YncE family protein/alkaline phosphatase family protein [Aneurinibacillus sp. Ricciae_BoGa-3]WCK55228.1 bifunctional YncE family protein/alkaline phosphatase family protein [Aneurinibacillus sp. Ricciae_BoGa-3]
MKRISRRKKLMIGASIAVMLLGTGTAFATGMINPGPKPDGTGITPHGWTLTPAGKQLTLGDFPINCALSPDGKYLVVTNDGQGIQSLQVVDVQTQQVVQTIPYAPTEGLFVGLSFSPDGSTLYASAGGNNKIRVYHFLAGNLVEQTPIQMKDAQNTDFTPSGLGVSSDGKLLFVANNRNNSVSKINVSDGQMVSTVAVGKDPYTAYLNKKGDSLYVPNWGESSVTVLDPQTMTVKKTISVGLHPNAITENPITGLLYVANSDNNTVSVIDPQSQTVSQTISLTQPTGILEGNTPNALTVSPDGHTLYVANAGCNDISVVDLTGAAPKAQGLIPTAWYPTALAMTKDGNQLMVLNAKGLGAGPNAAHQYIGNMMNGTMSFVQVPDAQQLQAYTQQVNQNNTVPGTSQFETYTSSTGEQNFAIPRNPAQKSPIKHVIYVIKENRTYDQIFGDISKGNGDPLLTEFGEANTPNLHKLANQFALLDNFYCDGEVSDPGHQWADSGISNDYSEKTWPADYSNRKQFSVDIPALKSSGGYLWDAALKDGISFRDYGEYINYWESPTSGKGWMPDDPALNGYYDPLYPGWNLDISDMTRYNEWQNEFHQFEQNDNLPQFEMVYLPNDHTKATTPGTPTPQAMVAQNDLAVGSLVDTVSHSKYWKDTAIFIVEDDPQAGADHVDAHRTEALVISPYTQTGKVDSTFYDQDSMNRTMEMILGMHPLNQFDGSAIPMLNTFTSTPNFAPYDAAQENIALNETNTASSPGAAQSAQMNWSRPDLNSEDAVNRIVWQATKGNQPYPKTPAQP